jgi:hypothetical protein
MVYSDFESKDQSCQCKNDLYSVTLAADPCNKVVENYLFAKVNTVYTTKKRIGESIN